MKILIITSYTVPEFAGGGRNAWNFAQYLNKIGITNLLLTLNRNLKQKNKEIIEGVSICRLPYFNANIFLKVISYVLIIWPFYLFQVFKSEYIYLVGANIIGFRGYIWLASLFGKKVIFRSSLSGFDDIMSLMSRNRFQNYFQHATFARLNTYVSINPFFTKACHESGIKFKNMVETSQGVDIELFRPASADQKALIREKYSIPSTAFVILSVGHIIERKGFDEIFDFLSQNELDFLYLNVGEICYKKGHFMSAYSKETEKLIKSGKSKLKDKFRLLGSVNHISDVFQLADIFILGSYREGTPNVLLEAMACGLPVICRDLKGITDYLIFQRKNGCLFNDYESFHNGLKLLYSNPDKCKEFGKYSRSIIERDFSFGKFYQRVFQQ